VYSTAPWVGVERSLFVPPYARPKAVVDCHVPEVSVPTVVIFP
jgi:hypothetical protein